MKSIRYSIRHTTISDDAWGIITNTKTVTLGQMSMAVSVVRNSSGKVQKLKLTQWISRTLSGRRMRTRKPYAHGPVTRPRETPGSTIKRANPFWPLVSALIITASIVYIVYSVIGGMFA